MPRNSAGINSPPSGVGNHAAREVIESASQNAFVADIYADSNAPRPITAGGTGATTGSAAATALGMIHKLGHVAMEADLDMGGFAIINEGTDLTTGTGPNSGLEITVTNTNYGNRSETRTLYDLYPITTQFSTTYSASAYPGDVIRPDSRISVNGNIIGAHLFTTGTSPVRQVNLENFDFFTPIILITAQSTEIDIFFGRTHTLDYWLPAGTMLRLKGGCAVMLRRWSTALWNVMAYSGLYASFIDPLPVITSTPGSALTLQEMCRRIPVDTTAGAVTVTLPSPTICVTGTWVEVTRVAGANNVTVVRSGGGAFTSSITANNATGRYEIYGGDWFQVWKTS